MNTQKTNRHFPFIKKNRYYNHAHDKPESFLFQTIPTFLSSLYQRKKRLPENKLDWIEHVAPLESSHEPHIQWIGHASFLIQVGGINIITDPIFGDASAFFPRILPPGIALNTVPSLDIVILSHNHRDHCDFATLREIAQLHPEVTFLVPQGDKQWLQKRGLAKVIEHTWWDSYTQPTASGASIECVFLPAHHWSAQGLFDRNKSLWGSWMIRFQDTSIYFAGDTAYGSHFKSIAAEFPAIHTALMPIAPGEPNPWMRKSHMDATQAVQAFVDLQAHHFVPMHWGTFQFGLDTFTGPLERLKASWAEYHMHLKDKRLSVVKVGQRLPLIPFL